MHESDCRPDVNQVVSVRVAASEFELHVDNTFTFGRSQRCTICLDPFDTGISRTAGSIEFTDGTWWLYNRSKASSFDIVRRGIRSVAGPGERHPVDGNMLVVVTGSNGQHHLELAGPEVEADSQHTLTGLPTAVGQKVSMNDKDRLALVVLFEGYLRDGERHDPWPRSYDAAVARLGGPRAGWTRAALVHRVDYLRRRLRDAGVPNMYGPRALEFLAEHVLTTGMISKDDLYLIGG